VQQLFCIMCCYFLSTPGMGWQFGFTGYGKTWVFAGLRLQIWSTLVYM